MPDRRQDVRAGSQLPGDVIGVVLAVMVGIASGGTPAQNAAVQVEKIVVVRADIDFGQGGLARHGKGFSKISVIVQVRGSVPDVTRPPAALGRSGVEICRRTEAAGITGLIPHADFPPASRGRRQRLARILYRGRSV